MSALLEALLILVGGYLYYRAAMGLPVAAGGRQQSRQRAWVAAGVTGVLLVLALVSNVLGLI